MRKNTQKVLDALLEGKRCFGAESVWTDGKKVYSYNTLIARPGKGKEYLFTSTRHSNTTSTHINGLSCGLKNAGYKVTFITQEKIDG